MSQLFIESPLLLVTETIPNLQMDLSSLVYKTQLLAPLKTPSTDQTNQNSSLVANVSFLKENVL